MSTETSHCKLQGNQRRGATLVLMVILLVVLVSLVAFSVDVGRMYVVRSQMQSAVDSGALGATLHLRQNPNDISGAVDAANEFVQLNQVGWSKTVPSDVITVTTGTWDDTSKTFTVTNTDPNAVQVAAVTDEPLLFAGVMGFDAFQAPRSAIAAGGGTTADIMLTLDLSGSMESYGRIEALQSAAPKFVDVILDAGDDDRIGVMGYGALPDSYDPEDEGHTGTNYLSAPSSLYPANSDWVGVLESGLSDNLENIRDQTLSSSVLLADKYNTYTPIGASIRDSAHYLENNARDDVDKVIVLMSDGHANRPTSDPDGYAIEMAEYADSLDIKIYTIAMGNSADEDLMQQIAAITGGEYFEAAGTNSELSNALDAAFQNVAGSIKRTQLVQ